MDKKIMTLVLLAGCLAPAMARDFDLNQLNPRQVIVELKAWPALTSAVTAIPVAPVDAAMLPYVYKNYGWPDKQSAETVANKVESIFDRLNYRIVKATVDQDSDANYGFTIQYTAKDGFYNQPLQSYKSPSFNNRRDMENALQVWSDGQQKSGAWVADLSEVMEIFQNGTIYWFEGTYGYPLKPIHN